MPISKSRTWSAIHFAFVAFFLFSMVRVAHANAISSTAFLFPGILPLHPVLGAVGTVLAAVLERPFLTAAGIERNTLRWSLRANYLSLIAGFGWLFVGFPVLQSSPVVYFMLSVTISILVEGIYLRPEVAPTMFFRWTFVAAANLFSAAVLIVVSAGTSVLREQYSFLPRSVEPSLPIIWAIGGFIAVSGITVALWPIPSPSSPAGPEAIDDFGRARMPAARESTVKPRV